MTKKTQWILDNWVSPILLLLIVVFGLALCSGCMTTTATAAESVKKPADIQTKAETNDKLSEAIKALQPQIVAAKKKLFASNPWKDYEKQRLELLKKVVMPTPEWKELNRLETESTRLKNIQTYLRKTLK